MEFKMAPAKLVAFISLPLIKISVYFFYNKMNLCLLQKKKKKKNINIMDCIRFALKLIVSRHIAN